MVIFFVFFLANVDTFKEGERETKIGGRQGQTMRAECCLLIALNHERAPSQQSLRWTHPLLHPGGTPPHPPSHHDPKPLTLYQHKKMRHGTFLFTLACSTPISPHPRHTHTYTHMTLASPFPTFVSVERHMVTAIRFPRLKVAFHFSAVHKEVRLRQTEILSESSLFCA